MTIGPIDPAVLGAALARSVRSRSDALTPGVLAFATRMNVPCDRIQTELAYISIITMHFCVGVVFGPSVRDLLPRAGSDAEK